MAIHLERIQGLGQIARVYDCAEPAPMAPYCATFVLEWSADDARAVWIKAMHGRLTRRTLRELAVLLVDLGVHTVLAHRADGHALPLGEEGADGIVRIDMARVSERLARPGGSAWADLPG